MTKALIDANIILDVLLARAPWDTDAKDVWRAHEQGRFEGYISAITVTTIFYLARKPPKDPTFAWKVVNDILNTFEVCAVNREVLHNALSLSFNDFEDAVQFASADNIGIDTIVTRNPKDFKNSTLPVFTPADFLKQLV